MNENKSSLLFFSELEKSITKKSLAQEQQHTTMKEIKLHRINKQKENSRYPLQEEIQKIISLRKKYLFHQQRW